MLCDSSWWLTPTPEVALACGSRSMSSTNLPACARYAPRETALVVFPTPPFWLTMLNTFAITRRQYSKFSLRQRNHGNVRLTKSEKRCTIYPLPNQGTPNEGSTAGEAAVAE